VGVKFFQGVEKAPVCHCEERFCDEAIYYLLIYIKPRLLHFVRNDNNPSFSTACFSLTIRYILKHTPRPHPLSITPILALTLPSPKGRGNKRGEELGSWGTGFPPHQVRSRLQQVENDGNPLCPPSQGDGNSAFITLHSGT
jgi:hypothetical protein